MDVWVDGRRLQLDGESRGVERSRIRRRSSRELPTRSSESKENAAELSVSLAAVESASSAADEAHDERRVTRLMTSPSRESSSSTRTSHDDVRLTSTVVRPGKSALAVHGVAERRQ